MRQNNPSSTKPRSPSQVLPESFRFIRPKITQAIERMIGIQIAENEIVNAKIILQQIVLLEVPLLVLV